MSGGDRLPWVQSAGGSDNSAPLTSLAWQAHVYGDARGAIEDACRSLGIPLHAFPWSREAYRAGFAQSALYLVRPDGYVGLADASSHPETLRRYAERQRVGRGAYFGPFRSLISLQAVRPFRSKPFSRFAPSRSLISAHAVHSFRCMPITRKAMS